MASRVQIVDQDLGARALVERMKVGGRVDVGVQGSQAGEQHEDPHGESKEALTVVDVATIHEFGDERKGIPRRSFIRDYVDHNRQELDDRLKRVGKEVIRGRSLEQALEVYGLMVVGEIQTRMANGIPPPNAASTVNRKGSDVPLIDTGQLRSSITAKVTTTRRVG